MKTYILSVCRPTGGGTDHMHDQAMHRDIDLLNEEFEAADATIFLGGISTPDKSVTIHFSDGHCKEVAGPAVEGRVYSEGFWIIRAASMAEAVKWGHKAAAACRAEIEVREFL